MLKTLFELCQPRQETLTGRDIDDVQELDLLLEKRIDPNDFFSKCFITSNMKLLFNRAFARLSGRSDGPGLIVLKQAMGGGKTHNMIALGLLAQYPSLRKPILGNEFPYMYEGEISVVGFTGRRTTELPWMEIARQLNRVNLLERNVKEGIEAPSDKEWRELLGGKPLLILLDEMPFYFEHAETVPKGDSNKAVFVSAGLANLFNAINSPDLSRVVIVLSDLEAKYEKGSEFVINKTALSLKDEAERTAETIRPIDISSPEIYEILRKKLFNQYPAAPETDQDVDAIAKNYFKFISDIEKAGIVTSDVADKVKLKFKECYPFHPAIIDLIANFRNNLKFQQTRGLLRLFRRYVRYLYTNKDKLPPKYFITVSDYDLSHDNDNDMRDLIVTINPDLDNAINNDVHSLSGTSEAQRIDKKYDTNLAGKFAKAILFASLSTTDPELSGLSEEEIYISTLEPSDDTTKAKTVLDEYWRSTSYSKENQRGKRYFGYNENVVAQMTRQREQITEPMAEDMLTRTLRAYFTPRNKDCYQAVYQNIVALPKDLSDLHLERDKVTLVISKPVNSYGHLYNVLYDWWEALESNKNRVMFLTGSDRNYRDLLERMKDYLAWDAVLRSLEINKVNPTDPEYMRAEKELGDLSVRVLERIKSTFNKLYYPNHDVSAQKDILQERSIDYSSVLKNTAAEAKAAKGRLSEYHLDNKIEKLLNNDRDGEVVIKESLKSEEKYIEVDVNDVKAMKDFDNQVQYFLLDSSTSKRTTITWDEITKRAADRPSWLWHVPDLLDQYKDWKVNNKEWIEENGEIILKPQFKAMVNVSSDVEYDFENDEIVLKLKVDNADMVYYSTGSTFDVNNKSMVEDWSAVRLKPGKNTKYTFVAVDSMGENTDNEPSVFTCPIKLKKTDEFTDSAGMKHIKVKSLPEADIYYTVDGSSPINSSTRMLLKEDEIVIDPNQVQMVIIVAQNGAEYSETMTIKTTGPLIDPAKPTIYEPHSINYIRFNNKESFYSELQKLKSYYAKANKVYIEMQSSLNHERNITVIISEKEGLDADRLKDMLEMISSQLAEDDKAEINGRFETVYFKNGKDFTEWLDLHSKKVENCIGEYRQL